MKSAKKTVLRYFKFNFWSRNFKKISKKRFQIWDNFFQTCCADEARCLIQTVICDSRRITGNNCVRFSGNSETTASKFQGIRLVLLVWQHLSLALVYWICVYSKKNVWKNMNFCYDFMEKNRRNILSLTRLVYCLKILNAF